MEGKHFRTDPMSFALTRADDTVTVTLPPVLDIMAVSELRDTLQEVLAMEQGDVALNGRAVERASTPCVQIMLAAARSAQERGIAFYWSEPSQILERAFADLGLSDAYQSWRKTDD